MKPTDAGPPAATPEHPALTVRLVCEVCAEELLIAQPLGGARYGAVDCPVCGSGYLYTAKPREGRELGSSASVG
jgi:hypothetical protein